MTGANDRVLPPVDVALRLLRGGISPQQKHQPRSFLIQNPYDRVRELLPAPFRVTVRLSLPHRQDRVQEENALPRPSLQAPVSRHLEGNAVVLAQLLVDVPEAGRYRDALPHRERQAVALPRTVVGIPHLNWVLRQTTSPRKAWRRAGPSADTGRSRAVTERERQRRGSRGRQTAVQVSHVVAEGGIDRETHVPERGEYTGNASRGVTSGGGRVYGEWRVILRRMFATPSLAIGIKNEETMTTRVLIRVMVSFCKCVIVFAKYLIRV